MAQSIEPQNVLITISGQDRAGITANLTSIIAAAGLTIQDMEQVVVRGLLSLSIVLEFPPGESREQPVLKDLLFAAKELGLELNFKAISPHAATRPAPSDRTVVTLIGQGTISAQAIARVTQVIADSGFNIETIQHLDQRNVRCLEMVVSTPKVGGAGDLKSELLPVGREFDVDIALQPDTIFRRLKRLVVFDLDSTLIQTEVINELADSAGKGAEVRELTERAVSGGMDFREALLARVRLLRGLSLEDLQTVYQRLLLTPGAENLIRVLKIMGYRTAVISGGFTYFTERIRERLGLDYAFGNELEVEHGRLTGGLCGPVIDGPAKADILERIAQDEHVHLDQVIAVGDGANDLPMLRKAGLGVAFNAKPAVRAAAQHSLNQTRMDAVLFLLGISEEDIEALKGGC